MKQLRGTILFVRLGLLLAVIGAGLGSAVAARAAPVANPVTILVTPSPTEEAQGFHSVWVLSQANTSTIERINPRTNRVTANIDLGLGQPTGNDPEPGSLAAGDGAVWVSDYFRNAVDRISPATNRVVAKIAVGLSPSGLVAAYGKVFVVNSNDGTLSRINPATNRVHGTVAVGFKPPFGANFPRPAAFRGSIWVPVPSLQEVVRVDPLTMTVRAREHVGPALACGRLLPAPGGFWMDDSDCSREMARYDLTTHKVALRFVQPNVCTSNGIVAGGYLYTAQSTGFDPNLGCSGGAVVKRNLTTGVAVKTKSVTNVFTIGYALGSIWANDPADNVVQRLKTF